jgi:hypothetical protein
MTPKEAHLRNNSHSLQALWSAFKVVQGEVAQTCGDSMPPDEVQGIEAYIEQLHTVDKGSFTFRYPLTKDGNVSVGDIERINLGQFGEYMERLCAYLEGIDAYYGHLIEMWNDMMSDYY